MTWGAGAVAYPKLAAVAVAGGALLAFAAGLTVAAPAMGVDAGGAGHSLGVVGYVLLVVGGTAYVAASQIERRRER